MVVISFMRRGTIALVFKVSLELNLIVTTGVPSALLAYWISVRALTDLRSSWNCLCGWDWPSWGCATLRFVNFVPFVCKIGFMVSQYWLTLKRLFPEKTNVSPTHPPTLTVTLVCFELEQIRGHFLLSSTPMSVGKSGLRCAVSWSIRKLGYGGKFKFKVWVTRSFSGKCLHSTEISINPVFLLQMTLKWPNESWHTLRRAPLSYPESLGLIEQVQVPQQPFNKLWALTVHPV